LHFPDFLLAPLRYAVTRHLESERRRTMSMTFGVEVYMRAWKRKAGDHRVFTVAILVVLAISALLAIPVSAAQSDTLPECRAAPPVDDPVNGVWSLAEADFYMARYGPDLLVCTASSEALARFHRPKPVNDPANGAWSLAEAESYAAKYGADPAASAPRSEALTRSQRGRSVDDPANAAWSLAEAEYYAAKYGVDLVASTSRSEALARSHRGQTVDDPANGAWSLAEAAYYIVKYRAEGINTVTLVNDVRTLFGDAGTNLTRP
jgi:hypothetical protein